MKCEWTFYGSATVGERGQIVIPAEARTELGFHPGDKVLIVRHPVHKGLMLFKLDAVRGFLDEFGAMLEHAETHKEEEE